MLNQQTIEQLSAFEHLIRDVDDLTDLRQVGEFTSSFKFNNLLDCSKSEINSFFLVYCLPAENAVKQFGNNV
jgi:hypothetical protein